MVVKLGSPNQYEESPMDMNAEQKSAYRDFFDATNARADAVKGGDEVEIREADAAFNNAVAELNAAYGHGRMFNMEIPMRLLKEHPNRPADEPAPKKEPAPSNEE